jgi:hypothetical protein
MSGDEETGETGNVVKNEEDEVDEEVIMDFAVRNLDEDEMEELRILGQELKDGTISNAGKERASQLGARLAIQKRDANWLEMKEEYSLLAHRFKDMEVISGKIDSLFETVTTITKDVNMQHQTHVHDIKEVKGVLNTCSVTLNKVDELATKWAKEREEYPQKKEVDDYTTSQRDNAVIDVDVEDEEDCSHLVGWPVDELMASGQNVVWKEHEPKEAQAFIKREQPSRSSEKEMTSERVREVVTKIAAFAFTHMLTGEVIMGIVRQLLAEPVLGYFDTLRTFRVEPKTLWKELQKHAAEPFTAVDAIIKINDIMWAPQGIKLAQLNLQLPHLVKVKSCHLGDSEEEKVQMAESCIDQMFQFLILNVKNTMLLPLIQEKYNKVKAELSKRNGKPTSKHFAAYCNFYNQLRTIPQLRDMKFYGSGKAKVSSMETENRGEADRRTGGELQQGAQRQGQGYVNQRQQAAQGQPGAQHQQRQQEPQQRPGQGMGRGQGNQYNNQGHGQLNRNPGNGGYGQGQNRQNSHGPNGNGMGGNGMMAGRPQMRAAAPFVHGAPDNAGNRGQMWAGSFPEYLRGCCWSCTENTHRSAECPYTGGKRPLEPSNPGNYCNGCGGLHRAWTCPKANRNN